MSEVLTIFTTSALYAAGLRLAAPVLFAALGETIAERAGMLNISLEGMMLMGALGAIIGSYEFHSAVAGIAVGILAALLLTAIQAVFTIHVGADQGVSGIALNIVALGATSFAAREIWVGGNVPQVDHLNPIAIPGLHSIPFVGPILFDQSALVYFGAAVALASAWALSRTDWGLRLRACGEDPRSSDSLGIGVLGVRWQAMMICGALTGLGGVFIALVELYTFSDGMSGGRGFIALAVVIIARWSPLRAVPIAFLFGTSEAFALRVQVTNIDLPYQLFLALPYVVTLAVYALDAGKGLAPAGLARPYLRS